MFRLTNHHQGAYRRAAKHGGKLADDGLLTETCKSILTLKTLN